jgi:pyruvate kinase
MASYRRTRMICTLGPACDNDPTLEGLLAAGMDVARLNLSHGTHDEHRARLRRLRRLAQRRRRPLATLLDLQGPKIRVLGLQAEGWQLAPGDRLTLVGAGVSDPSAQRLAVSHAALAQDVAVGQSILLDDGKLRLEVVEKTHLALEAVVQVGGRLLPRKGVNFPEALLSLPALTEKDREDVRLAVELDVDYIALSFVQRPEDLQDLRACLAALGSALPIIAKIEKPQAVTAIDQILVEADGIMVARGDLGVELPAEEVPLVQKRLIKKALEAGVPVITATQMLESMVDSPTPTRAEASDVANAVLDGTDAVMLSGETASGAYPVAAAETMARIAQLAEEALPPGWAGRNRPREQSGNSEHAVAEAACRVAEQLDAKAIFCLTSSGATLRQLSRLRPKTPLIALTATDAIRRRSALLWGVRALPTEPAMARDIDGAVLGELLRLRATGILASGDTVVVTAALPFGQGDHTNMLRIERVP